MLLYDKTVAHMGKMANQIRQDAPAIQKMTEQMLERLEDGDIDGATRSADTLRMYLSSTHRSADTYQDLAEKLDKAVVKEIRSAKLDFG